MVNFQDNPLYRIMHPRSIAFWGASNNPLGMGSVQLSVLLEMGFEGPVYPIHPKEKRVMGLTAYQRIADVPDTVDLAIFVLPTQVVPDILEECGRAGIKRAIIVTAGFGEMGEEGKAMQQRLIEIARTYGICFTGPNCIGVVNTGEKLNTTFFRYTAKPGFIGMASQSGSFVTQMFEHLLKFGIGFSQAFSVGNEAMTDITDCIEYLGSCPDTKVIGLYIEAIRRGREFFRVAREVSKVKPIVAYYIGGSEAGRKAALSHTGALAGPDARLRRYFQAVRHHPCRNGGGALRLLLCPGKPTVAERRPDRGFDSFRRARGLCCRCRGAQRPEAGRIFRTNGGKFAKVGATHRERREPCGSDL